jgi:hypothetical protein
VLSSEQLDGLLQKFMSRKLLVWITATTMVALGKITPEEWTTISVGYVGVEGFADVILRWKNK